MRRPNILVLMADQMTPFALPCHGGPAIAPTIAALAGEGVVFDAAYCAFPLCAPARAAFMTGRLATRIGVYDNACEFPADTPTLAHALRLGGYRTILSGKMHFCGADQLHGFEERLTTDIYPADFGWIPDWDHPEVRQEWFHNMSSVLDAGVAVRTNQLDFDDEVTFAAERKLFEIARGRDTRPFLMVVSMTHPHDPFAIPQRWWDLYDDAAIPMPRQLPPADDPHSRRVRAMCEMDTAAPDDDRVRAARRAYYGAISYVDAQFARLRRALELTGMARDTVIVVTSDHGEMLGERGLWYKMTFFEGSVRIPLIVHAPGRLAARRVPQAVSALDLLPTLLDLAGLDPLPAPLDGRTLLAHLEGRDGHDEALAEYTAEGATAPIVMVRRGATKLVRSGADPDLAFDLDDDPHETRPVPGTLSLNEAIDRCWNLDTLHEAVLASQRRRRLVDRALRAGKGTAWDWQPPVDASRQYVRSHMELDRIEASARFPRVDIRPSR